MIKINSALITDLAKRSKACPRKRLNVNFHPVDSDPFQRMLNMFQPGTYCQPHKHEDPDKTEVFIAVTGRLLVLEFDDTGNIRNHAVIDGNGEIRGVVIPPRVFHTIIPLTADSCVFEAKNGPYIPNADKNLAPWAPREGDSGCAEYNRKILRSLRIDV